MSKQKLYTLSYYDFAECRFDIQMKYPNPNLGGAIELTKKVPLDFIDKQTTKFRTEGELEWYLNNKYHFSDDTVGSKVKITYKKKEKNKNPKTKELQRMKEELLTLPVAYSDTEILTRVRVRENKALIADETYIIQLLKQLRTCDMDTVRYYLSKSKHIPEFLQHEILYYLNRDTNGVYLTECLENYRNFRDVAILETNVKKLK